MHCCRTLALHQLGFLVNFVNPTVIAFQCRYIIYIIEN